MAKIRIHEPPTRHKAPLPAERVAEVGFVYDPTTARLICPWKKGPLHFLDESRLLAVLARVDTLQIDAPVWIWSDPYREPVPVEAADPQRWLANWARDRASYQTRRRAA